MSAIDQVLSIEIVKTEHPRLRAEAISEIAQLRADLQAETQRADVLSGARNVLAAELQAAQQQSEARGIIIKSDAVEMEHMSQRIAALEIRNKELEDYHGLYMGIPPADTSALVQAMNEAREVIEMCQSDLENGEYAIDTSKSIVSWLSAHPAPAQPE